MMVSLRIRHRPAFGAVSLLLAAGVCGCGSSDQSPPAPSGAPYQVSILASRLNAPYLLIDAPLVLEIRNDGSRAIPDVTVTLDSLRSGQPTATDMASDTPAFLLVSAPAASATGDPHVFALGRLAPGRTAVLRATLRPLRAGPYEIDYAVSSDPGDAGIVQAAAGRPATGALIGLVRPSSPPLAAAG
jgi:hypothetical protein